MAIREQLHRLVLLAPEDDEPEGPEEATAVQEAREQIETIAHDEVLRRLGR